MTKKCSCCGTIAMDTKRITFDGGITIHDVCRVCVLTCDDLMRMKKIPFGSAYRHLKEALEGNEVTAKLAVYDSQSHDETLDIIKVTKEPILREDYSALEYDFLNTYIPNPFFANRQDQLNWLHELMEVALIGGDTKWATELYKQIMAVKERANNDTV